MRFEAWVLARLAAHGIAIGGAADGAWGRYAIAALKTFQRKAGLPETGVADGPTVAALRKSGSSGAGPVLSPLVVPPWLAEARRLQGLRETPGPKHSSVIMGWARRLKIAAYTADEIAWCGLLMGHVIALTLPDEPLPSNPLGARNWGRFGVACEPTPGAILSFWRGSRQGWAGHVALYESEDRDSFLVRGGNQANSVSLTRLAKSRLLASRWPSTFPNPGYGRLFRSGQGALSVNEA